MEVTLYFDGVEKKLPIKRNTIALRLGWQLLIGKHSQQATEFDKEFLSWKFRAEQISSKLSKLEINEKNKEEIERLKAIDQELVKENQDFNYKIKFAAAENLVEQLKYVTDESELTKEEKALFNSNLAEGNFWQDQDLTKMNEVLEFFR